MVLKNFAKTESLPLVNSIPLLFEVFVITGATVSFSNEKVFTVSFPTLSFAVIV